MPWQKSPPSLVAVFESVVPIAPDVEPRKMFGYPAAFVNGNMFMGLHQANFVVRLGADDRSRATADGFAVFEPMPGRPMKEYFTLPGAMLGKPAAISSWVTRSLAYARTLPPKAAKAAAKKGAKQAARAAPAKIAKRATATKKAAPRKASKKR